MKTQQLIAVAAFLAAATSVSAQTRNIVGADPYYPGEVASAEQPKTREQVRAELEESYRNGTLARDSMTEYPSFPAFVSHRSREEVRAEAVEAQRMHAQVVGHEVNGG